LAKVRQSCKELEGLNDKNCQNVLNKLKETEKKTVVKITDCEALLQQKAGREYVDTAIEEVNSKLGF
jgi:hypothetical protein